MPHALIVASDRQYCPRISAQKIHESRQFVEQGYSQKHPSPLNMGNRRNPERHSICAVARKLPAGRRAAVWDIARKLMRRKKHHPFLYLAQIETASINGERMIGATGAITASNTHFVIGRITNTRATCTHIRLPLRSSLARSLNPARDTALEPLGGQRHECEPEARRHLQFEGRLEQ